MKKGILALSFSLLLMLLGAFPAMAEDDEPYPIEDSIVHTQAYTDEEGHVFLDWDVRMEVDMPSSQSPLRKNGLSRAEASLPSAYSSVEKGYITPAKKSESLRHLLGVCCYSCR